jgi:uncharacterized integral membrane protein
MAIIRILLALLLAGLGLLLVFQNQMPFVVTLLGTPLQALPLGALLLAAIILGFLTGILLLLLLQTRGTPRKASTRRAAGRPFTPKNPFRRAQQPKASRNSTSRSAKNRTTSSGASDWHEVPDRDWTSSPNASAYRSERAPAREPLPDLEDLEFQRPPQREPERVVDADYRVLRQPYSPPTPDEEWEDDFFKDER